MFSMPRFVRHVVVAMLPCALWTCLAATTCGATEFWYGVDESPRQVAPNTWRFSIKVPVKLAGQLEFVGSQYDFAGATEGIDVDYKFNGRGIDFWDDRVFYAIAPTLFNLSDGFVNGWDLDDLANGTFSGVVTATAPLTTVHLSIVAESFVPVRRR